jgi:hypothetical protein
MVPENVHIMAEDTRGWPGFFHAKWAGLHFLVRILDLDASARPTSFALQVLGLP